MLRFLPTFALSSVSLLGCANIGPTLLGGDQLQYSRAISESQKREILLNIVRIRYGNAPIFLPVKQVISSFTLEQAAELGLNIYPNAQGGNFATGLGRLTFSDRPTITFAPLSGADLARTAFRPLSPTDLLPLAQGGLPIDVLFRLSVQSVGPLRNSVVLGEEEGAGAPEFFELLAGMRRLQLRGLLTLRFVGKKDDKHVFLGIADGGDSASQATAERVRQLLGMASGQTEAEVVYGRVASGPHQIAILTRSIVAVLAQVSAEISVPPKDAQAGRTIASLPPSPYEPGPIIRVHTGAAAPPNTDTAVKYGQSWFWIDDDDFNSKVAYMILEFLIALVQGTSSGPAPILTIPAG